MIQLVNDNTGIAKGHMGLSPVYDNDSNLIGTEEKFIIDFIIPLNIIQPSYVEENQNDEIVQVLNLNFQNGLNLDDLNEIVNLVSTKFISVDDITDVEIKNKVDVLNLNDKMIYKEE